jgi:hypothetical protein
VARAFFLLFFPSIFRLRQILDVTMLKMISLNGEKMNKQKAQYQLKGKMP